MREAERKLADTAAVFSALAHPSRRQILLVLQFRGGEMTAGEIAGRFECSWPTTTRHLSVLLEAGLVEKSQRGRHRIYRLNTARLGTVTSEWLGHFDPGGATSETKIRRR